MTYDFRRLTRDMLYKIDDVMALDNDKIKSYIRSNIFIFGGNDIVIKKAVKFIYRRVLQLREIILNCLRDMTTTVETPIATASTTEMHVDNENYKNIMRDRYRKARYPQLSSIISKSEQWI